jgi:leader peptidase (prepilin peptidase)/N-methyltransferase
MFNVMYLFEDIPMFLEVSIVITFSLLLGGYITSLSYYLPNPHIERLQVWHQIVYLSRLRSKCPRCHKPLSALDIIPLLGFVINRGSCRSCGAQISYRYPLIEGVGATFIIFAYFLSPSWASWWFASLAWLLILITVIDIETRLILDITSFPLMFLGLAFTATHQLISLESAIYSVIFGYLIITAFEGLILSVLKRDGLGEGDIKFIAASMAWVGLSNLSALVVVAALIAIIYAVVFNKREFLAFGPFLALSLFINVLLLSYNLSLIGVIENALH